MSWLYKSQRVGLNGKIFTMWKIKTLRDGSDVSPFASASVYLPLGRFLRKTKLDELPGLFSVLQGNLALVGYRPEEPRTWELYPPAVKKLLSKQKPGLISLCSLHFFDEERILQLSHDPHREYYEKIFPIKMALRAFYFENKCLPLKAALLWIVCKKVFTSLFKR